MAKATALQKIAGDLPGRQMRFVFELLLDYNKLRAIKAAGYKCKTNASASALASKLLKKPQILKIIEFFEKESQEEFRIERKEILWNLWVCATRNAKQFVDEQGRLNLSARIENGRVVEGRTILDLPDEVTAAIDGMKYREKTWTEQDGTIVQEIFVDLKLVSKGSAIDMAMKHAGLYAPVTGEIKLVVDEAMFHRPEGIDTIEQQLIDVESRVVETEM